MQPELTVKKSLIVQEDVEYGEDTVEQNRSGNTLTLNKVRNIYPVNSLEELNALDGNKFPKAILFSDSTYSIYQYNGVSYVPANLAETDSGSGTVILTTATTLAESYLIANNYSRFIISADVGGNNVVSGDFSFNKSALFEAFSSNNTPVEIEFPANTYRISSNTVSYLDFKNIIFTGIFPTSFTVGLVNRSMFESCKFNSVPKLSLNYASFTHFRSCVFSDTVISDYTDFDYFENCIVDIFINFPTVAAVGSTITSASDGKSYVFNQGVWQESILLINNSTRSQSANLSLNAFLIFAGLYSKSQQIKTVTEVQAGFLQVDNHSKIVLDSAVPLVISRIEQADNITELTLIANSDNVTITANDQIFTKNGLNTLLNTNQVIKLTKFGNKWLEV